MSISVLNQKSIQQLKDKMADGLLPQWVINNQEIHDMEMEKIFAHTWNFLAHESELKEPGDYVSRYIVDDPLLVVRTNDGQIKAFLNSCPHRGVQLCTADRGNRKTFTCPYHGWSFNTHGSLIGVVAGDKVYGDQLDKNKWGLRAIPRLESYRGMIFGSLDPDVMPLQDFLGDMKWYLDIMLGRSDSGVEVRGVPQKWIVNTNWKLTAENFGDPYHVQTSHRSTVELGMSPSDPLYAGYGHQVVLEHGHGINCITATPPGKESTRLPFQGTPEEMWPMFERNLSKGQLEVFRKTTVLVGTVFPNLSFNSPVHGNEGHLHNYLNFRIWRPIAKDKVEIWSWFMIDKDAPETYKEEAYRGYIGSFGPSGTLEQDDTEIWVRATKVSKAFMARDKDLSYDNVLNFVLGLDRVQPDVNFPGPGKAYPTCYADAIGRGMHEYWLELLTRDIEE